MSWLNEAKAWADNKHRDPWQGVLYVDVLLAERERLLALLGQAEAALKITSPYIDDPLAPDAPYARAPGRSEALAAIHAYREEQ